MHPTTTTRIHTFTSHHKVINSRGGGELTQRDLNSVLLASREWTKKVQDHDHINISINHPSGSRVKPVNQIHPEKRLLNQARVYEIFLTPSTKAKAAATQPMQIKCKKCKVQK